MEITARLTGDAQVRKVNDKEVVAFTIVIDDYYKSDGKKKEVSTFIYCSYWQNTKIAKFLTKSTVVTVNGRIGINSYKTSEGDFKANLTFHVNQIKIIANFKES